jgi:hypothetical protein
MRLSIFVATVLLAEQLAHTVGFSFLPTTTTASRQRTSSLAVLSKPEAPPTEITKNVAPEEETNESPKSLDEMQNILSTLDKRIKEGPGSLSLMEVEQFKMVGQRVKEEAEAKAETQRIEEEAKKKALEAEAEAERIKAEAKQKEDEVEAEAERAGWVSVKPDTSSFPPAPAAAVETVETSAPPSNGTLSSTEATDIHVSDLPPYYDLHTAALQLDSNTVASLIEAGLEMDEPTTNAAFWKVVQAVDRAEAEDKPLSADVPRMLHHIFDADLKHLLGREKVTTNITCMQPRDDGIEGKARAMSYIFDDSSHKDLPLEEGRRCEGGTCCDACSRNIFPTFALDPEISLETFPELASLTFNELENVRAATIIQFTRLIERVRRTIAIEYGLDLSTILPLQAYSRKYVAGTTQQGGGGGEGDFVTLHTDEATHDGYHYSCVLYLSTSGVDFEGGAFVFNDPAKDAAEAKQTEMESRHLSIEEQMRRSGRKLDPINPSRGNAVIFSSGWENMHEVEKITSGVRYAVPCFFTTCPVPEAAYTQMNVGKPKTDEDIADDWLHLLLAHRKELPHESTGRVKELLMKWHYMCTPLSQH